MQKFYFMPDMPALDRFRNLSLADLDLATAGRNLAAAIEAVRNTIVKEMRPAVVAGLREGIKEHPSVILCRIPWDTLVRTEVNDDPHLVPTDVVLNAEGDMIARPEDAVHLRRMTRVPTIRYVKDLDQLRYAGATQQLAASVAWQAFQLVGLVGECVPVASGETPLLFEPRCHVKIDDGVSMEWWCSATQATVPADRVAAYGLTSVPPEESLSE